MDIKKYMDDYYKLKINGKDVLEDMQISRSKMYSLMREENLETIGVMFRRLDLGIEELNTGLKSRYSDIVSRCNNRKGRPRNDNYDGLDYLPLYEWIDFCFENEKLLLDMWNRYIDNDRDFKLTISIDRLNNDKGYFKDNMQFITRGLNSYKRNINPVKVTHNGKDSYFMTCKEASRHYGIRENTIGDLLRGEYRLIGKDYKISKSDTNTVLRENNVDSLNDYYEMKYID